ncbi:hypothetical protein TRIUR3_09491 [Triticum urartu]|uniref:Disease resistance N-terminal domain-containing protein n=1 Tax=Triticum urartu TaxID=4572 RepID=M7YUZ3_TRIUA|nr:hypothetical protein TRIUR3_09491 [Triticum urartu]
MEMVVGASEATMKSLLSKLGGLLAHEYALIRGVRGDIQYINDEMASMQAFLVDLAPRGHDSRMKDWMKQIRDVTYDIEDCVDDFAHHLPHDPAAPPRPRPRSPLPLPRLRRLRDLDLLAPLQHRLRHRRAQGTAWRTPGPWRASPAELSPNSRPPSTSTPPLALVGTKKPVGVEEEMKELGRWLTLQHNEQQGSGGLSGKKGFMAAIGTVWASIMPKCGKDGEQRGGST